MSKLDRKTTSQVIGKESERAFKDIILGYPGHYVVPSTDYQDAIEKWDFAWVFPDRSRKYVDVKAPKTRYGRPNPDQLLVEFGAVKNRYGSKPDPDYRPNHPGWILSEKMDLLAFHKDDYFTVVNRKDLLEFVISKVPNLREILRHRDQHRPPEDPDGHLCYEAFERGERNDLVVWMPHDDIFLIPHRIVRKEGVYDSQGVLLSELPCW